MLDRVLIAVGLVLIGVGLYLAWTRWQLWRVGRGAAPQAPGLESLALGRPAILYFTTPGCVPCRVVHRPALEQLQAVYGEAVQVLTIDATRRPDAADHWGVLSAPTTFVLDRHGRARRVNHGVAGLEKLTNQLRELGELTAPAPEVAPIAEAAAAPQTISERP